MASIFDIPSQHRHVTPLSVFDKLIHLQPAVGQKLLTRLDCTWLQGQSRPGTRAGAKAEAEAEAEAESEAGTEQGGGGTV